MNIKKAAKAVGITAAFFAVVAAIFFTVVGVIEVVDNYNLPNWVTGLVIFGPIAVVFTILAYKDME